MYQQQTDSHQQDAGGDVMTTVKVADLHPGEHIRVGPHDIHCHTDRDRETGGPVHKDTPKGDIYVDAVVGHGTIGVIMCHDGPVLGAAVYDLDDEVERAS